MNMNVYMAKAIAKETGASEALVHGMFMAVPSDTTLIDFMLMCRQEGQR